MRARNWIGSALLSLAMVGASPCWIAAQQGLGLDEASVAALGSGFTYQGRLTMDGVAANGAYDFRFRLYTDPAGGMQVGPDQDRPGVSVTRGLFAVVLDFGGSAFAGGQARWLEIEAGASGGALTALVPRQAITPAPYALFAQTAGGPWVVSGSALTYDGGNVGIGTSSPLAKLHVSGGHIRVDTTRGLISPQNAELRTDDFGSSWHFFPGNINGSHPTPSSAVFWDKTRTVRTDVDQNADLVFDAQRGVISRQGAEMRTGPQGSSWNFYPGTGAATPSSAIFWNVARNKRIDMDSNANIALDATAVIRFGSECFKPVTAGGLRVLGLVACP